MLSHIWRINLATMLFFMLIQVVVPLIPRYALTIGATPFFIGLAVSSISITAILLRPVSGIISDKWSRSKLMMLGLIFGAAAYAIMFLFSGIYSIMIARLIEGVGVALFIPSSMASAVDQAPQGKVGEALGWRSLMIGIGFSVGPALGGILSEAFGYQPTFGITALLILLLLPMVMFREKRGAKNSGGICLDGLKNRSFILALSSLIIYAVAWMGLLTFLSAYLKLTGYGDLQIGLFVSIQAVASLALRVWAGRVADRRPDVMTYAGLLIISLSFLVVAIEQVPPYLYIASVIFGIGVGIFVPGSQTLALGHCPPNSRGFLSSIYTMGIDIGNLIGPVVFGAIIQSTGSYQSSFMIAPILTFIAALSVLMPARFKRQTKA